MRLCLVENCGKKHYGKNLCEAHYTRLRRSRDLYSKPIKIKTPKAHLKKHPLYMVWSAMKKRCLNQKDISYKSYGGRGISVCDRWLHSFSNFIADMGERPFPKAQIDRVNNNGNYEPGNCRWVSPAKNCQNRRSNKITERDVYFIRHSTLKGVELSKLLGISRDNVSCVRRNKTWKKYTK